MLAEPLPVEPRLLRASLLLGECDFGADLLGLGCGEGGLEIGGIEFEEDFTLLEKGAVLEVLMNPHDLTRDL